MKKFGPLLVLSAASAPPVGAFQPAFPSVRHIPTMKIGPLLLLAAASVSSVGAFQPGFTPSSSRHISSLRAEEQWTGEVVANDDGRIKGCTITPGVSETEFTIQIDGNEADLGNFGNVVYQKITRDAKTQQFQGFRPGTIPPHLLGTYKAFAMDEVAREAVLEAMQQNNIRPFDSCRTEMVIGAVSIPPRKAKKKKKKGGRKKKAPVAAEPQAEEVVEAEPAWETFDTMAMAIKAGGWEPGQSFSFVAKNCKGQKLEPVEMERPPVI